MSTIRAAYAAATTAAAAQRLRSAPSRSRPAGRGLGPRRGTRERAESPRPLVAARRRLAESQLPMVLGCDAAGIGPDGAEVIVHAVIGDPSGGDETLDPKRTLLSELHPGTLADVVWVPARNLVPKPESMSFVEAACLPTAWLTAYKMLVRKGRVQSRERGAGAGRRRRRRHGRRSAGAGARRPGLRHQPQRGQARADRRARSDGRRARRAAARARRRRDRDRGHARPSTTR